ncbi:MAG: hypothetical protein WBY94_23110 [Polyangiaceae bacterium]
MNRSLPRRAAVVLGTLDLVSGALIAFGVFAALPARWWPVDITAAGLAALELASGIGLLLGARWSTLVARASAAVALALGLAAVSLLAVTASWLSSVYGPVGRGGGIVLALVAALAIPYLVALPVAQLVCLRPDGRAGRAAPEGP